MADNGQQWVKTKNNSKQWATKAMIVGDDDNADR